MTAICDIVCVNEFKFEMFRNLASASTTVYEINDSPEENLLLMKLNDQYATVEYEKEGRVYNLTYCTVPDEYQGRGLGKILAQKTFDYVANNNLKVKITCDFLMSYYQKNEDKYKKFVVD